MGEVTPEALAGEWAAQADTWEHSGLNVRDLRKRIAQVRELAPAHAALEARITRLQAEVAANRDALSKGADDLNALAAERDKARDFAATVERDWNTARDLQLRYRAALEAIASKQITQTSSYALRDIAREALEGGHA